MNGRRIRAWRQFRILNSEFRIALACLLLFAGNASAQFSPPLDVPGKAAAERLPILKDVRIDQRLDSQLPLDLPFVDERGRDVRLGDFFGKRPVVLVLAYYDCPMLCTLVLNGAVSSLQTLSFDAGKEFDFVAVSFNPGETPALASAKKASYLPRYGRPGAEAGFHFLTGRPEAIAALTEAVGFHYAYEKETGQYAHPAVVTILTPQGKISRYLYGLDYPPRDLRLALVEAADGKIGSAVDQMLLYCYHYDPTTGKYGVAVVNTVRLAGLLTVAMMGAFVLVALRRERLQVTAVMPTATGIR